jgi:AcrR family transcriptional regulator
MTILTTRVPAAERREQIIAATLNLLARTSVESLTTRELASELGLTQPALFRHFRNRDALLLAVVEHAREELEKIVVAILDGGRPAVEQLGALGQALLEQVERQPGLPRLLFASATRSAGEVRDALRHVVAMQAALVGELVRQGQREGDVDAAVDAGTAATLFVGMLQALVLRWEIAARREPLAERFEPSFGMWLHGVGVQGNPAQGSQEPAAGAAATSPFISLDVRPLIARGVDPLSEILAALESLPRAGVLILEAPFRPAPLLSLMTGRGHGVYAQELDERRWLVEVVIGNAPVIEDLRDLEPPEPLERVLCASAALRPGEIYLARLPRFPRMLLPHLRQRDVHFDVASRSDGAALLRVEKLG